MTVQNERRKFKKNFQARTLAFKGECDNLHGYVFDVSDFIQTDWYTKRFNKITEYIKRNYQDSRNVL